MRHEEAIKERRVMYVGGIGKDVTENQIWKRFQKFGPIEEVKLYFRNDDSGMDDYAIVTFLYKCDNATAIEQGNNDVTPEYTLCYGGRRQFCKVKYEDLDNVDSQDEQQNKEGSGGEDDFDALLKKALRNR